jgi:hypothetical protein
MANTTPFRMIDKEAQRTFKVKYRLDGLWFNKIYAHYVEPVRGSFPVNYDLELLRERIKRNGLGKTWRPADETERLTDEIVELMRQAYTNLFKLNKKAELKAEGAGMKSLEGIKEMFKGTVLIENWYNKFHKIYGIINPEPNKANKISVTSWEKLPVQKFYDPAEIQKIVNKLFADRVEWYRKNMAMIAEQQEKMNSVAGGI